MLASSRVNPLPQVLHSLQMRRDSCGSGFTREEAREDHYKICLYHYHRLLP
ncbi:hypothetical protein RK21_05374 [Pseudomonas plecoglossicida]|nr:hypothetical protein RK21_05374 [Pseudomonas plecoglossicida]